MDGEFLGLQERQLQMEQQMLELVEERWALREELQRRKNGEVVEGEGITQVREDLQEDMQEQARRLDEERLLRSENQKNLEAQISMMQGMLDKKALHIEDSEQRLEQLQQHSQGLSEEMQRLKSKYKAKLLDK